MLRSTNGCFSSRLDKEVSDYINNSLPISFIPFSDLTMPSIETRSAYFGQFAHFHWFAPEKVPYAVTRYQTEFLRVCSVLDDVLKASPSGWLVGGKCTIADLSFVPWYVHICSRLRVDSADQERGRTGTSLLWATFSPRASLSPTTPP